MIGTREIGSQLPSSVSDCAGENWTSEKECLLMIGSILFPLGQLHCWPPVGCFGWRLSLGCALWRRLVQWGPVGQQCAVSPVSSCALVLPRLWPLPLALPLAHQPAAPLPLGDLRTFCPAEVSALVGLAPPGETDNGQDVAPTLHWLASLLRWQRSAGCPRAAS